MIGLLISAAVFWFITVYVTQDHWLNWWSFAIWVILGHVVASLLTFPLIGLDAPDIVQIMLALAGFVAILYAILRFRFHIPPKQIAMILGVYIAARLVTGLIFGWLTA